MSSRVVFRQLRVLARTVASWLLEDPVSFAMLSMQRLPTSVSHVAARSLRRLPGDLSGAAGAWLEGRADDVRRIADASDATGRSAVALGELALRSGHANSAQRLALRSGPTPAAQRLRARILWDRGDMTGGVAEAPQGSALRSRLESELSVFSQGWRPHVTSGSSASISGRLSSGAEKSRHRALWSLTNSLPHTQSGYSLRSHALLTALREHNVEATALTRSGYPTTVGRLVRGDVEYIDGIRYLRDLPPAFGRTPGARVGNQADAVLAAARLVRPTVLHTTTHFVNGLAVAEAAERLELPWVYEVRGSLEETWAASNGRGAEARHSERFTLFRGREVEVAALADRVIALGTTMASELVSRGIDSQKITVVPNAVGDSVIHADWNADPAAVRRLVGLSPDGVWVGTAASLVGYEGLDVLIDAVRLARAQGEDIRLLIVGGGQEYNALRRRAEDLDGGAAVFTGRLPQSAAQDHIRALDIAVVPRRGDHVSRLVTPLKPVELAGLGRPVILSDLAALVETLPDDARMLVRAEDTSGLADAICRLAADEAGRRAMGAHGRRFVEENRTWSTSARKIAEMYGSLKSERGGLTQ